MPLDALFCLFICNMVFKNSVICSRVLQDEDSQLKERPTQLGMSC